MAETSIQWTSGPNGEPGYTFNPWVGCQRVSPGCEHCYAEAYDKRVGGAPKHLRVRDDKPQLRWGPKADRIRTSVALWKQPLKWNREAAAAGQRRKVFCASLADVFDLHESIDSRWRLELFSLIRQTPDLDWLLLTKRPQNFPAVIDQALSLSARANDHHAYMGSPEAFEETRLWLHQWRGGKAPSNLWAGTTVEDQQRANERIPHLVAVPAAVRFLSCEPLLEDLNLDPWLDEDHLGFVNSEIDWVIIGGESGAGARPFDLGWARSLVWQCRNGGRSVEPTPFVKQLGAKPVAIPRDDNGVERRSPGGDVWPPMPIKLKDRHGGDMAEWPAELRVREFPEVRR
jgi:protein gp37